MNDFTILHLSDLHINKTGEKLPILFNNLLKDIKKEMEVVENIIIVVTGDLVHRGNYVAQDIVIKFFAELKKTLEDKVKGIYIVPGNHDKIRNKVDKKFLKEYHSSDNSEEFYKDYWKYIQVSFNPYIELVNKIYKIFNIKREKEKKNETYGVFKQEIDGKKIVILSMNTAWSCQENDERKLKFGEFQLKALKQQYEKLVEKEETDLTIAIAHHPLNWLSGKEETMVQSCILSNYGLNCDIYISGHIHNRDVISWESTRHSLTTLVSGLGWPDEEEDAQHPYAHTYSSYTFNLDINSIDVYVRSSDDNSFFEPDFRIYRNRRDKENHKIVMPIDHSKTQAFFTLGVAKGRSPKACYITSEILEWIQSYTKVIGAFQDRMYDYLEMQKMDFLEQCEVYTENKCEITSEKKSGNFDKVDYEAVRSFFNYGKRLGEEKQVYFEVKDIKCSMYLLFNSYLEQICCVLSELIEKEQNTKKRNRECIVRVHFRWWNRLEDNYLQLCMAAYQFEKEYQMKVQNWGELLVEAYKIRKPLIASVNRKYCEQSYEDNKNKSQKEKEWKDFLTAIPKIPGNDSVERDEKTGEIIRERPWITFGITVYNEEDRNLLYVLDYLKIDEIVSSCIQKFLYYMPVNIQDFVECEMERKWSDCVEE